MQDKKPDVPVSDDSNLVIVATPEYVKEAIAEHAASRNHPDATLQDKGFVILSNDTGSDSETMAATPKAVKTTYDLASIANQHASNANNNANTRLAKDQNGADIQNKEEFVKNIGLVNVLKLGDYGIGSQPVGISAPSKYDANEAITTGWWGGGGSSAKNFWAAYSPVMVMARTGGDGSGSVAQFQMSASTMANRVRENNKWSDWNIAWCTGNTTVIDGFIKKASSTIKIFSSGKFETNDESEGAIVERLSEGIYLIKNVLGFNADAAWGGIDSGIEIPLCKNKLPLIWVNYEVLPDGSIKLMTYHREHSDVPAFARNIREGYSDGDLIDIPDGRFVSVRVQMPDTK